MEKELFTQFDKIVNTILSTRARQERDSVNRTQIGSKEMNNSCAVKTVGQQTEARDTSSSCRDTVSADGPLIRVRALQVTGKMKDELISGRGEGGGGGVGVYNSVLSSLKYF